ncbi:MAG TPA: Ig-like domain-containing protein [Albitalea sp.]|uniref:Ig-like domain-containing protein n=1 Tax=Piscinibacter sp. TaxID=1903157 RepID=UPI002ECFC9A8
MDQRLAGRAVARARLEQAWRAASVAVVACTALTVPRPAQSITNPPQECEPPSRVTTITSPTANSNFHPAPRNITISAGSTGNGAVTAVQYLANGSVIGTANAAPWSITWNNVPAGSYSLQARTTARILTCYSNSPLSTAVPITVANNVQPSVAISSPANGWSTLYPASIPLSVNASDSDGNISTVQYYADGAPLTGALTAPFNFTWSGASAGTHTLQAVAKDNDGGQTTSAAVSVTLRVNAPPSISVAGPANGTVSTAPGTFTFTANASDTDGSVTSVQWLANGTPISGALTSPPYTFGWSGVGAGSYSITALATDNDGGARTSAPITVVSNDRPTSSLSVVGSNNQAPGSITLQATSNDSVGGVANVRYYANGSAISSPLTASPYTFNWTSVGAGSYSIVARATDTYGAAQDSAPFAWTVNQAPTVALTAPVNGAVVNTGLPATVTLNATAADSDGSVTKVEYIVNGSVVATSTAAPFASSWTATAAGSYLVQARATDNAGAVTTSGVAILAVDAPPTAAITAPGNGSTFLPGWDVPIAISAADSDGSVARVEVYDGSTLVATLTAAPYSTTLNNVTAGTHALSARAYDNQGAVTTSATVTISAGFPVPPTSSGTGTPGKLAGEVGVSGGGAAQYTIPIAIPPGTAGVLPRLALSYNSSSGNGVAGVGWSIAGLSVISRCGKDHAHENVRTGVTLTASDNFCLDGQRLILKPGTGAYGAPGSEYRTEIETFARVVAVGTQGNGPASFLVTLRDGAQVEYGNTADSRVMLPAASGPGVSTPIAWSLNKAKDPRTNFYTVTYATSAGQQVPARIDYTGNATSGRAPYNSVQFVYDTARTDVEAYYVLDVKVVNAARLINIKTYTGATLVKDYRIGYGTSAVTARSRISSVTECGDAGSTCLPPTTFAWEDTSVNFNGPVIDYPPTSVEFGSLMKGDRGGDYWIDLNGDGRPDHCINDLVSSPTTGEYTSEQLLCSLTTPIGTTLVKVSTFTPYTSYQFVDANGDGITDVCGGACVVMGPGGPTGAFLQPSGSGFTIQPFWIDLNRDGLMDYCRIASDSLTTGPYRMECSLGTGTGLGTPANLGPITVPTCTSQCEQLQFAWADVTGDGIPSFCRIDGGAMKCRRWTASGFGSEISTGTIDLGENSPSRAWVDVNGDGKTDFCRVVVPGTGGRFATCTLSTGSGFGETIASGQVDAPIASGTLPAQWWMDINGDGKTDYCTNAATGSIQCVVSRGMAFSNVISLASGALTDVGGSRPGACSSLIGGSGLYARCLTATGTVPDLLLGFTDGLGASASIQYRPISDSSVYTKGSGAAFPTIDMQDTTHVVQKIQASNGVGGTIDTSYRYEGAKTHLQGRGFLGFSAQTSTDSAGTASRVERRTMFPLTGTTARTIVTNSGTTLSDTSTSHASAVNAGTAPLATYVVYPTLTVTKTFDLDGSFINWVESSTPLSEYDSYGNPLSTDIVYKDAAGTPDGYRQISVMAYANDTSNWILGRPTSLTTTRKVPGKPDSVRSMTSSYFTANPGLGLLKQNIIEPTDATSLRLVTDYTYDAFGNVLTKAVSGPNIVARTEATYAYDADGRFALTQENALLHKETRTWDPKFGGMLSLEGPNQLTTSWTYDLFGRLKTEDRADGTRTTVTYNPCVSCVPGAAYSIGRTETVAATGATTSPPSRTYYDTLGRSILGVLTGFGGQEVYRETLYDNLGRVGYTSANYFAGDAVIRWTRYDYDTLGRTTRITAPDDSVTTATFNGRTSSTTNDKSVTKSRTVNSQGNVVSIIDAKATADQSTISYEYDHWGNLVKTTDTLNNVTSIEYDLRGRKTKLVDPDLGTWTYVVDNLGLVKKQTDNKAQDTIYGYDVLGRMSSRSEPDLSSAWYYERNAAGTACAKGIGKLCETTSDNGYFRRYSYDGLGRLSGQTTHIDADYTAQWSYNAAGQLDTRTFPASTGSPLAIKYNYNTNGVLQSVANTAGGITYWTRNSENPDGNVTSETYGNGLIGTRGYHPLTGRLTSLQAGTASSPSSVQDQGYHYDSLGRLDQRQDNATGSSETFLYDSLNRLTTATLAAAGVGTQTTNVGYDAIGNIQSKSGVGTYAYNASGAASVRPHAVSGVTGTVNGVVNPSYGYDNNGNMLTDGTRSFTWTSFNMPVTLTKTAQTGSPGAGTGTFAYGPEHHRVKQTWVDSGKTLTTVYLSEPHFEKESNSQSGVTEYKHYVSVGGRVVAIHTRRSDASEVVRYLLPDHLGSTSVVTDTSGAVIERLAYDPWGDRRAASGASVGVSDPTNTIQPTSTDRGYTGHEHLDEGNMGLVHMNGRVYDPTLARFISADPNIPDPEDTQSFNRYAYVSNSPLNATDPTGFFADPVSDPNNGQALSSRISGFTVVYNSGGDASVSSGGGSKPETAAANAAGQMTQPGNGVVAPYSHTDPNGTPVFVSPTVQIGGRPGDGAADDPVPSQSVELSMGSPAGCSAAMCAWPGATPQSISKIFEYQAFTAQPMRDYTRHLSIEFPVTALVGDGIGTLLKSGLVALGRVWTTGVANPVSDMLARVVPGNIKPTNLGSPGALDVFVTNASELRGLAAKQIADKLAIPESASFRVIEFPSASVQGIASPIGRTNPGFIEGGRTAGGAAEFVIPNGPIPAGAIERIVR